MKELGSARNFLGMQIIRDKKTKKLLLSQEDYVMKVIGRFGMQNAKPAITPLAQHFKLSKTQTPGDETEKHFMESVPYSSIMDASFIQWSVQDQTGKLGKLLYGKPWKIPLECGEVGTEIPIRKHE